MSRVSDMRLIYAAAKSAGMDEDTRRDAIERVSGSRSLSALDDAAVAQVAADFRRRSPPPKKRRAAPRADLRLIHVLWGLLGKAGKLKQPNRAGLNAFIRKRFGEHWGVVPADIDMLREHGQISDVIDALKTWCHREGVELED